MATQSEINDFVEQIMPYFDPTPVEDDAVEQSWPRLDRGLSDVQDMQRFQHLHGIFDRGGRPFWLRGHATDAETNSRNTLFLTVSTTTGTAESTIRGAFHRLREDIELEFPAVSSPTTQYVVDEYDPARAADGGDPIVSKVVTSLDYSQGKDYLVHWEVDRRPSQLLTDAAKRRVRPRVSPTILVADESQRPDPSRLLWGTRCVVHETRTTYMAVGATEESQGPTRWVNLTSPEWTESTSNAFVWVGHGHRPSWRVVGDRVELKGRVKRSNNAAFNAETPYTLIPNCPDSSGSIQMNAGSTGNGRPVLMNTGSAKPVFEPSATTSWIDLAGFFYYRA